LYCSSYSSGAMNSGVPAESTRVNLHLLVNSSLSLTLSLSLPTYLSIATSLSRSLSVSLSISLSLPTYLSIATSLFLFLSLSFSRSLSLTSPWPEKRQTPNEQHALRWTSRESQQRLHEKKQKATISRALLPNTALSLPACPSVRRRTEMCSGSEAGSYLRLIDFCIAQL